MKVICINNSNPIYVDRISNVDMIYEGEIYTVYDSVFIGEQQFYILAERNYCETPVKYLASRFIPLTGRGEVEVKSRGVFEQDWVDEIELPF